MRDETISIDSKISDFNSFNSAFVVWSKSSRSNWKSFRIIIMSSILQKYDIISIFYFSA
jgi:hypothetical protein